MACGPLCGSNVEEEVARPPVCGPSITDPFWFHFLPETSCGFLFFLCRLQRFKVDPVFVDFGIVWVVSDRKLIQSGCNHWDSHVLEPL